MSSPDIIAPQTRAAMIEAAAHIIHDHFSIDNADHSIPASHSHPPAPPPSPGAGHAPPARRAMVEAHMSNGDYQDSLRMAYVYLQDAMHDLLAFVRRAMELMVGAPAFRLSASGRGVSVMAFHTKEARDQAVAMSPIALDNNSVIIEPHEAADNRFYAFYSIYAEIAAEDFPLEHREEERIREALGVIGNVCCIDPDCLEGGDYTSVCAVLRLDNLNEIPEKLLIRDHSGPACIAKIHLLRSWQSDDPTADFTDFDFGPAPNQHVPPAYHPIDEPPVALPANAAGWVPTKVVRGGGQRRPYSGAAPGVQ